MDITRSRSRRYGLSANTNTIPVDNWNPGLNQNTNVSRAVPAEDSVLYSPYSIGKHWKSFIAQSVGATTTLVGQSFRLKSQNGSYECRLIDPSFGVTCLVSGDLFLNHALLPSPSLVMSAKALQKAQSKLLERFINAKNTWRGGNFLAEVRESYHMLMHPVKSIYQATWSFAGKVKNIGKIYSKDPTKYSKALADIWLAFIFGIKPAVDDYNDARTAMNGLMSGFDNEKKIAVAGHDVIHISARGRDETSVVMVSDWTPPDPPASYLPNPGVFDEIHKSTNSVRLKGAFKSAPLNTWNALEQFGVGLYDILPAIWEGIPWSFFIDYFLNVQEMADSLRLWSVNWAWLNRTVRNSSTINFVNLRPRDHNSPSVVAYSDGARFYSLGVYVRRDPISLDDILPSWHFKMPGLGSLKWLNIAALATQCYGSKPHVARPNIL